MNMFLRPDNILLVLVIFMGAIFNAFYDAHDIEYDTFMQRIYNTAFALVLAGWVLSDAQRRRKPLCYDYDTFIFVAWPLVLPAYLFQSRGPKAFLTIGIFVGIIAIAYGCQWLLYVILVRHV